MSLLLKGNSGCRVEYIPEKNIVRKTSTKELNERLLKQKLKQLQSHLLCPKIKDWGNDNGVFYYDMEYIDGLSGSEFIIKSDFHTVEWFLDSIFKDFLTGSKEIIPHQTFIEKIDTLPFSSELKRYDWSGIPKTECHGDLSLENMIVSGNRIYYIDLLNGISSYYLDIGKIMMDFRTLWSFREFKLDMNDQISINFAMNTFNNLIPDNIKPYIQQLTLYQIARVIPYCNGQMRDYMQMKFKEINEISNHTSSR